MMTLDEAIAHAREMASKLRKMTSITNGKPYEECLECASEHEQLAAWLEELKRYKSRKVLIKVKPQDSETLKRILQASQFGIAYPDTQYEVVPMVSGGPSDEEHKRRCKETADMLQIILNEAEAFEYGTVDKDDGTLGKNEGVLVKNVHFNGSFDWVISEAIDIIRGASI